jgi:hypothetical protein
MNQRRADGLQHWLIGRRALAVANRARTAFTRAVKEPFKGRLRRISGHPPQRDRRYWLGETKASLSALNFEEKDVWNK